MFLKSLLSTHKIKKWLLVFAALYMQANLATANIIIELEEPSVSSISSGIANLRGWAIGLESIDKIELFIDGEYISDIPSGGTRTDVGKAFPSYPNAAKSGFSMAFPYSSLYPGEHTVLVRASDVNGFHQDSNSSFQVTRLTDKFISDPSLVSLSGATVEIEGNEIAITSLNVDGHKDNVRLRWRVATQQFEIEYVFLQNTTAALSQNNTKQTITATQLNAFSKTTTAAASASSKAIIISLEEPSAGLTSSGIANLRGWAIGQATIAKIELFIDGQYFSDVPTGGARTDVNSIYPEYPDSAQSGFSMAFPYSSLSKGTHTALVRAHDINGLKQDAKATFYVERFANSFISTFSAVSLEHASVRIQNERIILSNVSADKQWYNLTLQWRTATQQFEIQHISSTASPVIPPQTVDLEAADAARFLTQSTFGPTTEAINQLLTLGSYEAWLEQQFSMPITTSHLAETEALWLKTCPEKDGVLYNNRPIGSQVEADKFRVNAWWESVINGDDQLRQRVALALSEIFVISRKSLFKKTFGIADYYDLLQENAFGNYRTLLEKVTLHPAMGFYLSMLQSRASSRSDENYAREVLQLFSIGLVELNLDGSPKLAGGETIPSYNQDIIKGFAKVFTGWNFSNADVWRFNRSNGSLVSLMTPWEDFHDSTNEKLLLNGVILPPGQTATKDLRDALDNIFNHPNVGPFISKQLIQRLVTSNPTPAYVSRIAQIFNNNGVGVRGDLKSVITGILLDDEARKGHLTIPHYGKLREPILRLSHLRRAFDILPASRESTCGRGTYFLYNRTAVGGFTGIPFGQGFLNSPSVFNFFLPDYTPSGPVKNSRLVSPEFQIVNATTTVNLNNEIAFEIFRTDRANSLVTLRLDREIALASQPNQLIEHLDLLLLNGNMSSAMRQILLDHLINDSFPEGDAGLEEKAKSIIALIVSSPDYLIQK